MSKGTLAKVSAQTAAEVCKRFKLSDDAAKLLRNEHTPRQFLDLLLEQKQFIDAARFLAHGLPKPEGVWWACVCARSVAGTNPPPKIAAALIAAEKWIVDPSEDNRRAAMPAAEAAELGTPAGCAAVAAFWSGGSLGPPHTPTVPPGEHLTAHGVASAVMLAAIQSDPAKAPEKYAQFFKLGIDVANGSNRWKERRQRSDTEVPSH